MSILEKKNIYSWEQNSSIKSSSLDAHFCCHIETKTVSFPYNFWIIFYSFLKRTFWCTTKLFNSRERLADFKFKLTQWTSGEFFFTFQLTLIYSFWTMVTINDFFQNQIHHYSQKHKGKKMSQYFLFTYLTDLLPYLGCFSSWLLYHKGHFWL